MILFETALFSTDLLCNLNPGIDRIIRKLIKYLVK